MPLSSESLIVYIIDDEQVVREGFSLLMRSAHMPSRAYASAEEFLADVDPKQPGCVLLDITMPRSAGLQFQQAMQAHNLNLPVIAVSARDDADIELLVQQMGAQFYLRKPVDGQALLDAISWVLKARYPSKHSIISQWSARTQLKGLNEKE